MKSKNWFVFYFILAVILLSIGYLTETYLNINIHAVYVFLSLLLIHTIYLVIKDTKAHKEDKTRQSVNVVFLIAASYFLITNTINEFFQTNPLFLFFDRLVVIVLLITAFLMFLKTRKESNQKQEELINKVFEKEKEKEEPIKAEIIEEDDMVDDEDINKKSEPNHKDNECITIKSEQKEGVEHGSK